MIVVITFKENCCFRSKIPLLRNFAKIFQFSYLLSLASILELQPCCCDGGKCLDAMHVETMAELYIV